MFTEPETNNCFSINDQALSNFVVNSENKERIQGIFSNCITGVKISKHF